MVNNLPLTLVVDASILFSFFNIGSERRRIIEELPHRGTRLVAPKYAFEELISDKERVLKYSKINEQMFAFLLSMIEAKIDSFPEEEYIKYLSDAHSLSPHKDSTKDDPYFALALSLNCPIWSDEKAFKEQSEINIFSTEELFKLLSSNK